VSETTFRPLKIFIVENHADTLKYLRIYLEEMGHQVFEARNMTEAVDAIPECCCDVLISDIGLPDGDGWSLLKTLQAGARNVPRFAIAMSGFGMSADRSRSRAAGYREHLMKPFDPENLDELLRKAEKELVAG